MAEHRPTDIQPAEVDTREPVVVITNEDMAAFRKEQATLAKDPNVLASVLSDKSVQGYSTDKYPECNGAGEIKEIVGIFRDAGIPCCLVAEAALIYYGARRVMHDCHVCVPTEQLNRAADLFRAKTGRFESFRRSALSYPGRIDHLYSRFKVTGLRLFFILVPAFAYHLEVRPENIELSDGGLPYPALPAYAQSLLDSKMGVDLDDLIDGMNLTLEWGEQHLDLEGTVDASWIWWKHNVTQLPGKNEHKKPSWYSDPDKRREIWTKATSDEAKKTRQGWKFQQNYETRFRKAGTKNAHLN